MNFLVMPLFFLSGAIFPLQGLPKSLTVITMANPLSYGIDGLRATLVGLTHFGIYTDLLVLSLVTCFFFALGSWLFSRIEI